MKKLSALCLTALSVIALSGCATSTLIKKDTGSTHTKTIKQTLIEDKVVAFAKPALKISGMPNDAVVIVGQKNSYVLTQGGHKFETLMTHLDPHYISLTAPLDFYSAHNDGKFTGTLSFKYTQRKDNVSNQELDFFLKHQVKDCTSHSDKELGAKGYCFNIELQGAVYPAVSNQASLKALSRLYPVSIYTETQQSVYQYGDTNPVQKLVLLPFAVAFDVVTLPFQALNKIFD